MHEVLPADSIDYEPVGGWLGYQKLPTTLMFATVPVLLMPGVPLTCPVLPTEFVKLVATALRTCPYPELLLVR